MTLLRSIHTVSSWATFVFGTAFNGLLILLIVRHTPKQMRTFSKILLQTCITDLLFAVLTLFAENTYVIASSGANEVVLLGAVDIQEPRLQIFKTLLWAVWVFFVYVSLFNLTAQFIYRYLVLNWDKQPSLGAYLCCFCVLLCVPLAYVVVMFIVYLPPSDHQFLDDPQSALLLGMNVSERILLVGYTSGTDVLNTINFYYIFAVCTLAYATIWVLGFLMHRFVRNRPLAKNNSSNLQDRIDDMNRQITRTLLIQAVFPLTIYGPQVVLFLTIFGVSFGSYMHYYDMLNGIPMAVPAALNPLITMLTIKPYRNALLRGLCRSSEVGTTTPLGTNIKVAPAAGIRTIEASNNNKR